MRKLTGEKLEAELARLEGMRAYEHQYESAGIVCGIDEAGRGPLAGPVVAAVAVLPKDCTILRLNDSKKLSEKCREELFLEIKEKAAAYGIGIVSPEVIDSINILQATYEAMRQAVAQLPQEPDIFLNDAVIIPGISEEKQIKIIKGDAKSVSIAAASILAKVTRDHMMMEYDKIYPEYGFAKHKGYGTKMHNEAILTYGPCPIHRRTFLKKLLGEEAAMQGMKGAEWEKETFIFMEIHSTAVPSELNMKPWRVNISPGTVIRFSAGISAVARVRLILSQEIETIWFLSRSNTAAMNTKAIRRRQWMPASRRGFFVPPGII